MNLTHKSWNDRNLESGSNLILTLKILDIIDHTNKDAKIYQDEVKTPANVHTKSNKSNKDRVMKFEYSCSDLKSVFSGFLPVTSWYFTIHSLVL